MQTFLKETCGRLVAPIVTDAGRWRGMWEGFHRLGLSQVDRAGFDEIFSPA